MEDRFPILDILEQTPDIPDTCQWAIFLRNHDELTLEMVTDEERDYMYRAYASDPQARINLGIRRRLAPLLGNDRRRIELMNALLFSLPGTPVLYYGDEIGMGDNFYLGDRNGVRTPMQWSPDRNARLLRGQPPAPLPAGDHRPRVPLRGGQRRDAAGATRSSLLWWMRRLIALRKRYQAFGRGTIEFLHPENRKVLAFVRAAFEGESASWWSRTSRASSSTWSWTSRTSPAPCRWSCSAAPASPAIGELPYLLTLGPHGFYWFSLGSETEAAGRAARAIARRAGRELPVLRASSPLGEILNGAARRDLEEALPAILAGRRWFGGKSRGDPGDRHRRHGGGPRICGRRRRRGASAGLVDVEYIEEEPETYVLPLAYRTGEEAERLLRLPDEYSRQLLAGVGGRTPARRPAS